jgi:hypothetical protein
MTTISWGKRERYKFASCGGFIDWAPPVVSAIYAITYKQEPEKNPKSHTVLYFGESEDLSQQAPILKRVENFWRERGGLLEELYVFVHPMADSSDSERSKVHDRLVTEYEPHINQM